MLSIGYLRAGFDLAIARLKRGRTSRCGRLIEDELQFSLCALQALRALVLFFAIYDGGDNFPHPHCRCGRV